MVSKPGSQVPKPGGQVLKSLCFHFHFLQPINHTLLQSKQWRRGRPFHYCCKQTKLLHSFGGANCSHKVCFHNAMKTTQVQEIRFAPTIHCADVSIVASILLKNMLQYLFIWQRRSDYQYYLEKLIELECTILNLVHSFL